MKAKLLFFMAVNLLTLTAFSKEQDTTLLRCSLHEVRDGQRVETKGILLSDPRATETEVLGLIPIIGTVGEDLHGVIYLFPKSNDGVTRALLQIVRKNEILSQNIFPIEGLTHLGLIHAKIDPSHGHVAFLGCKKAI